ncbi:hypothetical protein CIB48_g7860 [Xylaria polymorpha]|nr:hypothetical protein CIB48_g7860 [Xylaria polymorpha]
MKKSEIRTNVLLLLGFTFQGMPFSEYEELATGFYSAVLYTALRDSAAFWAFVGEQWDTPEHVSREEVAAFVEIYMVARERYGPNVQLTAVSRLVDKSNKMREEMLENAPGEFNIEIARPPDTQRPIGRMGTIPSKRLPGSHATTYCLMFTALGVATQILRRLQTFPTSPTPSVRLHGNFVNGPLKSSSAVAKKFHYHCHTQDDPWK